MMSSKLASALNKTGHWLAWVAIACTLLIMLSTCINAIARRFLDMPISGIVEYNEGLLIGMVFFALPLTQIHKRHVAMEFIAERFPTGMQPSIQVFANFIGLITFIVLAIGSSKMAIDSTLMFETVSGAVRMPIWPLRWFIPLGSFFICLVLLHDMVMTILSLVRREKIGKDLSIG